MAEGGGFTSLRDGSDADFDIVCTPCGEDNIREEAVKYCPECQEYLCKTCTRHHGRLKATRSHRLQPSSTAKQSSVVRMTTICQYHPDLKIDMYCGTHDMVYCAKCVAKEHRACNGVNDVDEINPSTSKTSEIQRVQTDIKILQDRLVHIGKMTQKNIHSLEKQRGEIADNIEEVERKLIEHIRKLKHEAVNNLKKEYAEAKNELEFTASLVDDTRKEIEKSSTKMQSLFNMDARQQFIQIKLIQNTLTDTGKLLAENEAKGSKTLCFTENSDLKNSITTSQSLGQVHKDTAKEQQTSKIYKVKSTKKINVEIENDKNVCCILHICQLPDGTIILSDYYNWKIKRLDMNHNIKDHCDFDVQPVGICCIDQNEVAVQMSNNKVQFISVGSSLSKFRQISIDNGSRLGMACCAGELWISNGNGVNVYSTSGTLLKTISKDINGKNIFGSDNLHMASSGETVFVADGNDGAVYLGRDGTVIRSVRDERLRQATAVCVSKNGTMFLSYHDINTILMFDKDGKYLGELETYTGPKEILSLGYDDKRNCLIVAGVPTDIIVVLDVDYI